MVELDNKTVVCNHLVATESSVVVYVCCILLLLSTLKCHIVTPSKHYLNENFKGKMLVWVLCNIFLFYLDPLKTFPQ